MSNGRDGAAWTSLIFADFFRSSSAVFCEVFPRRDHFTKTSVIDAVTDSGACLETVIDHTYVLELFLEPV